MSVKKEMAIEDCTPGQGGSRKDKERSQFYFCIFSFVNRGIPFCSMDQLETARYHLNYEYTVDWHKPVDSNNNLSFDSDDTEYSYGWKKGRLAITDWPKLPLTASINGAVVSVGSIIYIVGGRHSSGRNKEPSKKVFKLDTLQSSSGWQEVHSLSSPRIIPAVYQVDSKIYVLGGGATSYTSFGEVYDTKADKWTALPEPPADSSFSDLYHDLNPLNSVVVSDSEGRNTHLLIYPYVSEKLYAYDLEGEYWTLIDAGFGQWEGEMAVVGNTLFVSDENCLRPYDLVKKKWLRPVVPERDAWLLSDGCAREHFINMGNGKLCYISYICERTLPEIVCTKFAVSKRPNPNYVVDDEEDHAFTITVSHEDTTYYQIESEGICEYCTAI